MLPMLILPLTLPVTPPVILPALNDSKMLSHVDKPTTQLEKIESASERSFDSGEVSVVLSM